jgi:carbamoyltransferase
VANGKITRNTPFTNVYIPSAGHDAGISMGSALFVQHQLQRCCGSKPSVRLIPAANTPTKNQRDAGKKGIPFTELEDGPLFDKVSSSLQNGG